MWAPFFRWDQHDSERTQGDTRELIWTRTGDDAGTRARLGRVFRGVSGSIDLLDPINRTARVLRRARFEKRRRPAGRVPYDDREGVPVNPFEDDFLYSASRDDYLQLELTRYF